MMMFTIKELLLDEENPEAGINAISIVDDPAIKVPFTFFGQGLLPFFKWTAFPDDEIIETSHQFCIEHAYTSPDRVYHTSEIREWSKLKDKTFIPESDFFATFSDDNVSNYNGDQQIYNCRHYLERVSSINEVPKNKRYLVNLNNEHIINFKIENDEQRIIKGLVLQSNQMIFRNNVNGSPGYVFLSRNTIRKLKDKYGMNRSLTFQHKDEITGNAILMKSYLIEDDVNNITKWYMEYKLLPTVTGNKIWNIIKGYGKDGMGFSIEALLHL